jgi:peptidoglycan/LPS O-acetylase OafA/YrhL
MHDERYHEIDLLRFLAALSVVLYHYTFRGFTADNMSPLEFSELAAVFRYGYLGVNLFFIISGFVILLTAMNRSATGFVESRVIRLFPAYWFCASFTFLVTLTLGAPRFSVTVPQYLVNLTMIHEVFGVTSLDGVYWTLLIELKFYFLVWILVLLRQIRRVFHFLAGWLVLSVMLHLLHAPKWAGTATSSLRAPPFS